MKIAALIGTIAYELRYALMANGAPGPWTTLTLTNARKLTLIGLTPAGTYQFHSRVG